MNHSTFRIQISRLLPAVVCTMLLVACKDEIEPVAPVEGDYVDVAVSVSADEMNGLAGSVRSHLAASAASTQEVPVGGDDDIVCERVVSSDTVVIQRVTTSINDPADVTTTAIKNLWILQYDGTTDAAKLLTSAYIENYGTGAGQTQTAKLIATTTECTIVFLANTFDATLPFQINSTITELKGRKFSTKSLGTILTKDPATATTGSAVFPNDGYYYQRMNGAATDTVTEGATISGTLAHNACRVSVNVTNNTAGTTYPVTLTSADIENVPGCIYFYTDYSGYTSGTAVGKPTTADNNLYGLQDYTGVITWTASEGTSATTKSAKLYLSANESGIITANESPKLKSLFAPSRATILRIHGTYKDGSNDIPVTYSFALGEDMTQNYQLVPNGDYVYNITLNARGDKTTDGRVSYGSSNGVDYTVLTAWPLSNCYICNPPATGSATYKIPVARVDQFWGGGNYENVQQNCLSPQTGDKDWTVSVIWSDMPVNANNFVLTKSAGTGKDDYFEVSIPSTCVKGNVIVGIQNGNSKWLWSWHLWVTDYCPDDAKYLTQQGAFLSGTDTYHVTGGDVQRYQVAGSGSVQKVYMDRCIGAMDPKATGYPRGAMYYQFGRKDPFPGSSEEYYKDGATKQNYTLVTKAYNATDDATQPKNVPYSVYNPTTFITGNGVSYWTYGDQYNPASGDPSIVWNDPHASNNGNKSIFDPSPSGWKVPTSYSGLSYNTFSGGICNANTQAVSGGGSVSIPVLGYRNYTYGSLSDGSTYGYYWSSTPSGTADAYGLYFYSGYLTAYYSHYPQRACGEPVRPVQE